MTRWWAGAAAALALLVTTAAAGGAARSSPREREAGGMGAGSAAEDLSVCPLQRGEVDRTRTSSLSCIACHDGSTGPGIEFQMRPDGTGMSHPVDVHYGSAFAREPNLYVAPGALPPETPLVDGKVACTSCHDPLSPSPNRVAQTARLCESCHRL